MSARERGMQQDGLDFRGFLGEGSSLEGDLRFEGPFRIDGRVAGRVVATAGLWIGPMGEVEVSTLEAESLVVAGTIRGTLHVTRRLEVLPGGAVLGQVRLGCPGLTVHPGGRVDGDLDIADRSPANAL
jgi:cytoskeletal protein CcmA (bactofilin family)